MHASTEAHSYIIQAAGAAKAKQQCINIATHELRAGHTPETCQIARQHTQTTCPWALEQCCAHHPHWGSPASKCALPGPPDLLTQGPAAHANKPRYQAPHVRPNINAQQTTCPISKARGLASVVYTSYDGRCISKGRPGQSQQAERDLVDEIAAVASVLTA